MYKKHFKKVFVGNPEELKQKAEQTIKNKDGAAGSQKGDAAENQKDGLAKSKKSSSAGKQLKALFYFTGQKVDAKELSLCIHSVPSDHLEVWRELNILEVVLEKDSLVFQDATGIFEDPEDMAFLEAHHFCSLYSTDYAEADEDAAFTVYKEILATYGGVLCSDTEDFRPMWKLSSVGTLQRIR